MSFAFFVLRVLAGALFIVTGFTKLIEPHQNFLAVIHSYKVVSGNAATAAAIALPWAELILGVFLLKGLWIRFSAAALWAMNSVFFMVVASAIWRKLPIEDCGCFGEAGFSLSLRQVLGLDAVLWVVLGILFIGVSKASILIMDRFFEWK
ncbi:MAG: MauE/DoxX family redox-associated membrane protein [Candidatus Omnitrophota bacterium]